VWPQRADSAGRVDDVKFGDNKLVQIIVPVSKTTEGMGVKWEMTVRFRLRRPIAAISDIVINTYHDRWSPFSLTVPLIVRPSFRNQLLWTCGLVLGLALPEILRAFLTGEYVRMVTTALGWAQDPGFWLRSGLLFVGILLGLAVLSRVPFSFGAASEE
jgi:hypothetical protein